MREERLVVQPFEDFQVQDYKAIQQVNEHAQAEIKGTIPYDRRIDYMKAGMQQMWVQVVAVCEDMETILFYGLVKELQVKVEDGTCVVSISLCSGTQLMDYEEHIRSFQEEELTYRNLLDTCSQGYEKAAKIMTVGKENKIRHFIMQYRETDWAFIKRLAAQSSAVVFADCSTEGVKYHFGIPDRVSKIKEFPSEYQMQYNMQEYWYKKNHNLSILPEDSMSYVWESREIHELGERNTVNNKDLFIWKIESSLRGNELYHICYMKTRSGFQTASYNNKQIAGTSLLGKVTKVKNEKVQIKIHCDENKEQSGVCWYSFSTVYSSPDGTGWYCMPEIGDTVRLYFPTNKEEDAYVASAYHEECAELRTRPECKSWRNREGKEIQLTPDRILLTNNDGTYIELSDDEGIEIVSENSVTVRAGGCLSIASSNSSIEISAPKKIQLKQGDTQMNLGGDLTMQGAKIRL